MALESACSLTSEVINSIGTVESLLSFIRGSAKHEQLFQNAQLQEHGVVLKAHCDTRWSSRQSSITSVFNSYESLLDTLLYIESSDKSQAAAGAVSLRKAISEFDFIFMSCSKCIAIREFYRTRFRKERWTLSVPFV